jgi:hypothetical protein
MPDNLQIHQTELKSPILPYSPIKTCPFLLAFFFAAISHTPVDLSVSGYQLYTRPLLLTGISHIYVESMALI